MTGTTGTDFQNRLQWSLFSLRLGVFIVMIMWTFDKFVNPGHSARIFEHFYANPFKILVKLKKVYGFEYFFTYKVQVCGYGIWHP